MNDTLAPAAHEFLRLVLPVAIFTIIVGTALLLLVRKLEIFLRRRRRKAREIEVLASENAIRPVSKPPICPLCQRPMVLRKAGPDAPSGKSLWDCSSYPDCRGTREMA